MLVLQCRAHIVPKTSFVVEKVSSVLYKQKFLTYVLADFFFNNLTKKKWCFKSTITNLASNKHEWNNYFIKLNYSICMGEVLVSSQRKIQLSKTWVNRFPYKVIRHGPRWLFTHIVSDRRSWNNCLKRF